MKKTWFILLLMLTVAVALPALAQTTAVDVNGKTYVFSAENGTYAVDGITFRVEDGQISAMLPDGTFVGATHRAFPIYPDRPPR